MRRPTGLKDALSVGKKLTAKTKYLGAARHLVAVGIMSILITSASGALSVPSASASSGGEVTVGMIGQFSGPVSSSFGALPKVLAAWASSVNAAGGLDGKKVRVVSLDTEVGIEPGLGYAHTLIGTDHAVAIIDTDADPDAATWLPYAQQTGTPVIFSGSQFLGEINDPNVFPVVSYTPQTLMSFIALAKTFGPNLGMVSCSEAAQCAGTAAVVKLVAPTLGVDFKVNVSAPSSAPDFTAVCQDLKNGPVQSYYLQFASAAAQRVADTCYQQGIKGAQLLTAGTSAPYWHKDPAFRGDVVIDKTAPYFGTSTPAERAYRAALSKYASSVVGTNLDNSADMSVWAGGQLISAAAKNVTRPISPATLTTGLYSLKKETLGGLVQPLTFIKGMPTWLPCNFVWKIGHNGRFSVADGGKPVCVSSSALAALTKKL